MDSLSQLTQIPGWTKEDIEKLVFKAWSNDSYHGKQAGLSQGYDIWINSRISHQEKYTIYYCKYALLYFYKIALNSHFETYFLKAYISGPKYSYFYLNFHIIYCLKLFGYLHCSIYLICNILDKNSTKNMILSTLCMCLLIINLIYKYLCNKTNYQLNLYLNTDIRVIHFSAILKIQSLINLSFLTYQNEW